MFSTVYEMSTTVSNYISKAKENKLNLLEQFSDLGVDILSVRYNPNVPLDEFTQAGQLVQVPEGLMDNLFDYFINNGGQLVGTTDDGHYYDLSYSSNFLGYKSIVARSYSGVSYPFLQYRGWDGTSSPKKYWAVVWPYVVSFDKDDKNKSVPLSFLSLLRGWIDSVSCDDILLCALAQLGAGGTVQDFIASFKSRATGVADSVSDFFDESVNAFSNGPVSFLGWLKGKYASVSSAHETDGKVDFTSKLYDTGAFSTGVIWSIVSSLADALGVILVSVSKVVGFITMGVNYLFKVVGNLISNKINESTYAKLYPESAGYAYVNPLAQITITRSDPYYIDIRNKVRESGILKVFNPGCETYCWFTDDTADDENPAINIEVFPTMRITNVQTPWHLNLSDHYEKNTIDYSQLITDLMDTSSAMDVSGSDADDTKQALIRLEHALGAYLGSLFPANVEVSDQGSQTLSNNIYVILKTILPITQASAGNNSDWATINNNWQMIQGLMSNSTQYYGSYPKKELLHMISLSLSESVNDGTIAYGVLFKPDAYCIPPRYTQKAITEAVAFTAVATAAVTAVAIIGSIKWKKFARAKAATMSSTTESAWEKYKQSGSEEDYKAYRMACLKQNTLGKLFGCSSVNPTNFWAAGSESADVTNIADSLNGLSESVTPEAENDNLNILIYKAVTGGTL